jgi:hypothetical protein
MSVTATRAFGFRTHSPSSKVTRMTTIVGQFIHFRGLDGLHTSICERCLRIVASQVEREQVPVLEEPHSRFCFSPDTDRNLG